jgi:hypothetical protein
MLAVSAAGGKLADIGPDEADQVVELRWCVVDGDVVVNAAMDNHDAGRTWWITGGNLWRRDILDDVFDLYGLFLLFHCEAL